MLEKASLLLTKLKLNTGNGCGLKNFKTNNSIFNDLFSTKTGNMDSFTNKILSKICSMPEGTSLIKTENGECVGNVHYFISDNIMGAGALPDSWLTINSDGSRLLKPFLWLETIIIDEEKRGNGYGKEVLKQLYNESVAKGCGGRMLCHTAWNSHLFYGKCGWQIFGNIERAISRHNQMITKYEADIAKLEQDASKAKELSIAKECLKKAREELELIKQKLPYSEDTIMFDPTPENIAKLCQ